MNNNIFIEFLVNNPPIKQIKNYTGTENEYGERLYASGFFRCDGCLTIFYDDSTKEYRHDKDNHKKDCPYRLAVEAKQAIDDDSITAKKLIDADFSQGVRYDMTCYTKSFSNDLVGNDYISDTIFVYFIGNELDSVEVGDEVTAVENMQELRILYNLYSGKEL